MNFPAVSFQQLDLDTYMNLLAEDKKNVDSDLTSILCEGPGRLVKRKIPLDGKLRLLIERYFRDGINRG